MADSLYGAITLSSSTSSSPNPSVKPACRRAKFNFFSMTHHSEFLYKHRSSFVFRTLYLPTGRQVSYFQIITTLVLTSP